MFQEEKRDWNSTAAAWRKWQPISEKAARMATERMLDMADISSGDKIIDFATGLGDTAAACARRVGPEGTVFATDGANEMLILARQFIATQAITNITFDLVNFDDLKIKETGFDAGVCRWGLMFAKDLVRTLSSIRRLLRPGGKFAAIVWGEPERAEVQSLANRILMESLGLPLMPTGKGTPFALSDRASLEMDFATSGFTYVESETIAIAYDFRSSEEYVRYRRERSNLEKRIAHCAKKDRENAWALVAAEAEKLARPDKTIRLVSEANIVVGQSSVQQYF